jgi:hypothetical protein
MTTAADDARPSDPWLFRAAHYQVPVLIALVAVLVVDHYVRSAPTLLAVLAFYAAYGVTVLGTIRHRRGICLACGDAFPLDAPGLAQGQRRRALRTFHLANDHPGRQLALIAAVVILNVWVWWLSAAMWACFAVNSWAAYWHRLLEPYCPFCRRGGRGNPQELVPVPTPDPVAVVQR